MRLDRDSIRLAAVRTLMQIAIEPVAERELTSMEEQVARLLISGRGISDICNALSISPPALCAMLLDLAR